MTSTEFYGHCYDILVAYAGAPSDQHFRESFVYSFTNEHPPVEFRFCGDLGFGGKFWRNDGRHYVTCYREDETRKRKAIIAKTNREIDALVGEARP